VAGLTLISAAARPLIHAAEVIAQIVLITTAALLGAAVTTVVIAAVIRARSRRGVPVLLHGRLATRRAPALSPPAPTWARAAITGRIQALGPADRCPARGPASPERRQP
jgi:hypothetical protein